MVKFVDISKKYGTVTHDYPFAPYKLSDNYRGKPLYKFDLCIGCAACGIACPSNAITVKLNENQTKLVWEFDCGRCIFCGRCDEVCPTGAIRLSEEFELAVRFDKSDLIQRGELEPQYCTKCNKPFSTKKLINYSFECLSKAQISEQRLQQAKSYLHICQSCKENNTAFKLINDEDKQIK